MRWQSVGALVLAACNARENLDIGIADPALLCDDDEVTLVRIDAPGLLFAVTNALTDDPQLTPPRVTLQPASGLVRGSAPASTEPVIVPSSRVRLVDRDSLAIAVDAGLGLTPGAWTVEIRNGDGEVARAPSAFTVAGAPRLTGFAPGELCQANDASPVTLEGEGFLLVGSLAPTVEVGGRSATVVGSRGCSPLSGPIVGEVCTAIDVVFDATGEALGGLPVVVTNPSPAACTTHEPASLEIVAPPAITAVAPDAVCRESGGEVEVSGSGFVPGSDVVFGDVPAESVVFLDETRLLAAVGSSTPIGWDDVTVVGPHGCDARLPAALHVVGDPVVFFVDPPVAWSGAAISVQVYVADVVGTIDDAWLTDPAGARIDVVWSWDPAEPGLLRIDVPPGLPDGEYGVSLTQDGACGGALGGALAVRGDLTIPVESVSPRFAWTFDHTPVDVWAADPLDAGEVGFADTPRVLLIGPAPAVTAWSLLGVDWEDAAAVHAVIPDSLDVGTYDVLVVNPDGALGLLPAGVEVTFDAPPQITAVSPGTLPNSVGQQVAIYGQDFRDPAVEVDCLEGGTVGTYAAPVLAWTFGEITASFPAELFGQAVCLVRVINADGAMAEWSAVSVTNPAQNLFPWQVGPDLVIGRRAPAAAAGRTTSVQRWLYAIGGDDGTAAGAFDSIEVAPIDVYGGVGEWTLLSRGLPEPRTLAAVAVIGRFVYLVGGHDGTAPTASVLRAQILDPLEVPYFSGLSVVPSAAGLGPGAWTYRVAATFDPTDLGNPGGESLPSDPIQINLPDIGSPLQPVLSWTAVDGAVGYRIYRTPQAGEPSASVAYLTDVVGTSFTDAGGAVSPGNGPLEPGALGAWAELDPLDVVRESPCLAVVHDPFPDPVRLYLYAAGGRDGAGVVTGSLEHLDVTVVSEHDQVAGAWTPSALALSEARYQCAGYGVDSALHSVVDPGEGWVYFAGGLDSADRTTGTVDGGQIASGGELLDWQTIDAISPTRAGFAHASASDFLYLFGGQNAAPNKTGTSGQLTIASLPDVENWNSLGNSLSEDRYLPGSAQESAVIFVIGGETDDEAASRSVDFTNF